MEFRIADTFVDSLSKFNNDEQKAVSWAGYPRMKSESWKGSLNHDL